MKYYFGLLITLVCSIGGCGSYQIPQPDINHPAHPQAVTSEDIQRAEVLEIDDKNLPEMPDEMKNRQMRQHAEGDQQ